MRNYAIGAFLLFALVGGVIWWLAGNSAERALRDRGEVYAEMVSTMITGSRVIQAEYLETGYPEDQLDHLLNLASALAATAPDFVGARVITPEGTIVVSRNPTEFGAQIDDTTAVISAAQGETVQETTTVGGEDVIVTYVPFRLDGEIVGALELEQSVSVERERVTGDIAPVLAVVGVGMLLLYLGLLPVVKAAGRSQEQSLRRLRELDAAKDELLAFSAHEFRTPLTSLLGFAQTLADRRAEMPDEQVDESLQTILRQARRLGRVADDFLDVAAIEAGRLEAIIADVSLASVARDVTAEFAQENVSLVYAPSAQPPETVILAADRERLEQVLTNLVRNALQHGPPDGNVELSARVHDDTCAIDVVDDGPGLSEEDGERLFTKFEGGSGRTRGSGLGLYISRHLMEAQGGALKLVPDTTRTTFRAEVPLAARLVERPGRTPPAESATEPSPSDERADDTDVAPRA